MAVSAMAAYEAPGVGVYKEANVMRYFIELGQFSKEDSSIPEALRAQLKNDTEMTVRVAAWSADRASPNARPDVTLINAARPDWRRLKERRARPVRHERAGDRRRHGGDIGTTPMSLKPFLFESALSAKVLADFVPR
jgi:hypothetical protein